VQMEELVELDENSDETQHKIPSFASQQYDWEQDTEDVTRSDGTTATAETNTYLATNLNVHGAEEDPAEPVNFGLTTELYEDGGELMMKFSVNVVNWPWYQSNGADDDRHTLKLVIDVQTGRQQSAGAEYDYSDDPLNPSLMYKFHDGWNVKMNNEAYINGDTSTPKTVSVGFEAPNNVHLKVNVIFPYFVSSLDYDPYIFWDGMNATNSIDTTETGEVTESSDVAESTDVAEAESNSVSRAMGLYALVVALGASLWML